MNNSTASSLEALQTQLLECEALIQNAATLQDVEKQRIHLLGKNGLLTLKLKEVGQLPADERPKAGQSLNKARYKIQSLLESKKNSLSASHLEKALKVKAIDVSLPFRGKSLGSIHPLTQMRERLEHLFKEVGFCTKTGPEVEQASINFTDLNIPENHPARALHDTFYIKNQPGLLLRTHTSNVQVHALKEGHLPLKVIATGAVYRCDSDVTHTPMFHQLEGMVVNKTANFKELKGLLTHFLHALFETTDLNIRFRASYFPFTEPSAEVDVQCVLCEGKHCSFCGYTGWLEILGCGMVHPNVLRAANIDPNCYQGYAFGIGIERLTLLFYHIPDIRLLFENNSQLLSQFI